MQRIHWISIAWLLAVTPTLAEADTPKPKSAPFATPNTTSARKATSQPTRPNVRSLKGKPTDTLLQMLPLLPQSKSGTTQQSNRTRHPLLTPEDSARARVKHPLITPETKSETKPIPVVPDPPKPDEKLPPVGKDM